MIKAIKVANKGELMWEFIYLRMFGIAKSLTRRSWLG